MKMAFIVHNDYYTPKVMAVLQDAGVDYYTRWAQAHGKGHGTEPHVGTGGYASTNAVLMIAFPDEGPLAALIKGITAANAEITRAPDKIRLFQLPLERMI